MASRQQSCPNNMAGCNWKSPDNDEINNKEDVQVFAEMHYSVCPTTPNIIQMAREHQEQAAHRRQRMQELSKERRKHPKEGQ